jgi:hypothetical protein
VRWEQALKGRQIERQSTSHLPPLQGLSNFGPEPRAYALGYCLSPRWGCRLVAALPDTPQSTLDSHFPTQYRLCSPRMKICPREIAGDAYTSSFSSFLLTSSYVGPAFSTNVSPASLVK